MSEEEADRTIQETLEALAESMELSGVFEKVDEENAGRLAADPEWSTPKHVHIGTMIEAFAAGVIMADPLYKGYKLPPDFEGVVNWIADCIGRHWNWQEVPIVSLVEMKKLYWGWAIQHPSFMKWNETDKLIGVTGSHQVLAPLPEERDFIDIHAAVHQAVIYLRNDQREFEAFNKKFEEEYGHLSEGDE